MSLREKAREIKAKGAEERGDYTPTGVPKRMYTYWVDNLSYKKQRKVTSRRENFCHFWRVVAIWAPLMWLKKTGENVVVSVFFLVPLALALLAAFVYALFTVDDLLLGLAQAAGVILALVATVCGLFGGMSLAVKDDHERQRLELPAFKPAIVLSLIGLWSAILAFIVSKAIQNWGPRASRVLIVVLATSAGAVALSLYAYAWIYHTMSTLINTGIALGLLAGAALLIFGLIHLEDYIKGARALAISKQHDEDEAFYDKNGIWPWEVEKAPRKPSKVGNFFRGVGDFIILLAQVVRVNKWKICPTVDFDR